MEEEKDAAPQFLDVSVHGGDGGELTTSVSRKTTNLLQILAYYRNYSLAHKRNFIITFCQRVWTHYNTSEAEEEEICHLKRQIPR